MTSIETYKDPSAMTPLFSASMAGELNELALELIRVSSKLSGILNPYARAAMAKLVEPMNSYYSNLIEGHFTHPLEIEKAIKNDYSKDKDMRLLQLEGIAHIRVNKLLKVRLKNGVDVVSKDFICWIHEEFYNELPEDLRVIKGENGGIYQLIPGKFRENEVLVGQHTAPSAARLDSFIELFIDSYNPNRISDPIKRIVAIAASHHRLAWIHPFLDGNGRMLRLFSEAFFIRENLHADGIWSISRGLAVFKEEYYTKLNNADQTRFNDYDGRGNLSDKMLGEFCVFFLTTAVDQVNFMTKLFEVDDITDRVNVYVDLMVARKLLKNESRFVLIEALLRGKIIKGDMERITGRSENNARAILKGLIDVGLLVPESDNVRAPLLINFPIKAAPFLFPRLFPKDIEATLAV
jgi:Fic family protein